MLLLPVSAVLRETSVIKYLQFSILGTLSLRFEIERGIRDVIGEISFKLRLPPVP